VASYQKIVDNTKTKIDFSYGVSKTLLITNTSASSAVTIDLYVTSQNGSDIVSSTVLAAETEVSSKDSVTLTVDTVSATADVFKDERVYTSTGALYGVCTGVTNTTTIVFADGLESTITNNDILYTGNRYYILNNVVIPNGASLKLESSDFGFNSTLFNLYIISDSSDGDLNLITTD
jgi:hypothetical protein